MNFIYVAFYSYFVPVFPLFYWYKVDKYIGPDFFCPDCEAVKF